MKKIKSLGICNRGEVAVRIIRACQELGVESVLLHSEADQNSRAFRMADRTECIGPSPVGESYLHIENNIIFEILKFDFNYLVIINYYQMISFILNRTRIQCII